MWSDDGVLPARQVAQFLKTPLQIKKPLVKKYYKKMEMYLSLLLEMVIVGVFGVFLVYLIGFVINRLL